MVRMTYMFEGKTITPTTWCDLSANRKLRTIMLPQHCAMLVDDAAYTYCFVYFDEAGQCSNPYKSFDEANAALDDYVTKYLQGTK